VVGGAIVVAAVALVITSERRPTAVTPDLPEADALEVA
jgi:hypothetical protein